MLAFLCGALWYLIAQLDQIFDKPNNIFALTQTYPEDTKTRIESPTGSSVLLGEEPLSDYKEILQRPIFFKDRLYPQAKPQRIVPKRKAPTVRIAAPKKSKAQFNGELHGVLIDSEIMKALLSSNQSAPVWVELGEKVGNWTLHMVTKEGVILRQKGVTTEVKLHSNRLQR